jgi:hypothetical protein
MMFSRIPPKQCASRWLWGVHVIFFLAGSILKRCGKFHFDFFVECVLSNHIFFALSLYIFLIAQFFPQLSVGDYLRPPNPMNVPKTSINKSLKLSLDIFCHKTSFATIQQDQFDTGIEQLNFEVQVDVACTLAWRMHLWLCLSSAECPRVFLRSRRSWILGTRSRFFPNSKSLCCSAVYTEILGLFDVDSQPDFLGFFHKIVELRLHASKIERKEHNVICVVEILKMFGKIPQDPSPSSI